MAGNAGAPTRHITTLNLFVVCFFWTIGGFYGTEGVLATGPPRTVLAVCCVLPFLYSLPTALLAVELATMFPETTGGQCDYVRRVVGPRLGAHNTYWVWITTVIDSALYPQFVAAALQAEFDLSDTFRQWLPLSIVALMAGVNMAGIDWLLRFEVLLGAITLIPCIILLCFGLPQVRGEPLMANEGELRWSTMISWSLWLYGGFTNIGVLAGETCTPRRSYLISVAILVPMKLLFRFTPFVIAFSIATPGDQDQFGEGYFQSLAEQLGGRWLSTSYLIGAQIAFVGFYNAMVINAERTACFFCEGLSLEDDDDGQSVAHETNTSDSGAREDQNGEPRARSKFGELFDRWGGPEAGCLSRFWFGLPQHGVRRIYCLVIAILECGLVLMSTDLLVELAMMIYSLSFLMFMVSYIVLRRRYSDPPAGQLEVWTKDILAAGDTSHSDKNNSALDLRKAIDAGQAAVDAGFLRPWSHLAALRAVFRKWRSAQPTVADGVFTIPGGTFAGVAIVTFPTVSEHPVAIRKDCRCLLVDCDTNLAAAVRACLVFEDHFHNQRDTQHA